jgi:hypothetical protein
MVAARRRGRWDTLSDCVGRFGLFLACGAMRIYLDIMLTRLKVDIQGRLIKA